MGEITMGRVPHVELIPSKDSDDGQIAVILAPPGVTAGPYRAKGAKPCRGHRLARVLVVDTWTDRRASQFAPRKRPRNAKPLEATDRHAGVSVQPALTALVDGMWSSLGALRWHIARFPGRMPDHVLAAWCGPLLVAVVAPCKEADADG